MFTSKVSRNLSLNIAKNTPIRHLNIPGVKKLNVHIPEIHYIPDELPPVATWRFNKAFDPITTTDGRKIEFKPLPEDKKLLEVMPNATVEDLYYVRQANWIAKHDLIDRTEYGKFEIKYSIFFFASVGGLLMFAQHEEEHRKHHPFHVPTNEFYRAKIMEKGAGWFPVETCQLFEFSCFRRSLDKADMLMKQFERDNAEKAARGEEETA